MDLGGRLSQKNKKQVDKASVLGILTEQRECLDNNLDECDCNNDSIPFLTGVLNQPLIEWSELDNILFAILFQDLMPQLLT